MGSAQFAPALFTRMSSDFSRSRRPAASFAMPSLFDRSEGSEMQVPRVDSSEATESQTSALRAEM